MKRIREDKIKINKYYNKRRKLNKQINNIIYRYKVTDESDSDEEIEKVVENGLPTINVNVTENDNHIYFRSSVSNASVDKLVDILNDKNKEFKLLKNDALIKSVEPKPLYLFITSYGGSLFAGFRAIDAIMRSDIPVYTVVDGHAASAATLMSVCGKKRYMTPHSYMLIHQLSSGAIGKYWDIKDEYNNCTQFMEDIYKIYLNHTNMSRQELEETLSHDSWWTLETCKEKGLIDGTYNSE